MKICVWHSDKPRERILADAICDGIATRIGDEAYKRALQPAIEVADADVAFMVGVKSRELFRAHFNAGTHVVMVDKGYTRHAAPGPVKLWEFWRVAVDAHHPTERMMEMRRPSDRFERLELTMAPWRKPSIKGHVLIAGSSQKYHDFYGLKDPTPWTAKVVDRLRELTQRKITYRPKPSWKEAQPVDGAAFSREGTIEDALRDAHAMVTHGSNACFESVLAGVPCVVLGDAVAKPISSTALEDIENPLLVSMPEREQWAANLAYAQWTMGEFASGEAWRYIRPQIYG